LWKNPSRRLGLRDCSGLDLLETVANGVGHVDVGWRTTPLMSSWYWDCLQSS
jgi:hypothetical protein